MSRSDHASPSRGGCWRQSLLLPIVLVLAFLAVWGWWRWSSASHLAAELERIRALGQPVTFDDLLPEPAEIAQEATPFPFDEIRKLNITSLAPIEPSTQLVGRGTLRLHQDDLANYRNLLDRIAATNDQDPGRLPVPPGTSLPAAMRRVNAYLSGLQAVGQLLRKRFLIGLAEEDTEAAIESILLQLALSQQLRHEPFLSAQLARYRIGRTALDEVALLLGSANLSEHDRERFDRILSDIERSLTLTPAVLGERALTYSKMDEVSLTASNTGSWRKRLHTFLTRASVKGQVAEILRTYTAMAEFADTNGPEGKARHQNWRKHIAELPDSYQLPKVHAERLDEARVANLFYRQQLRLARLALWLDRYRDEHGQLPDHLVDAKGNRLSPATKRLGFTTRFDYHPTNTGFTIVPEEAIQAVSFTVAYPTSPDPGEAVRD
ncbi:hypothetical protein Pan216_55310 [Planctomycetes bacterium Pan216]|uniref:Uncharacterized protein n=1 Tax=Kolteria novifilia TaxID=2527975 RepID=A0A518BCC7_9BACT|nr:hypothetical protein Pan216_55310 [Planctomycetes bacterium Pan216]